MEKNNIEIQIDNLKAQTVLLEKLLKMNQQYENKYGPINDTDIHVSKTNNISKNINFSSMLHRRSIC